MKQNPIIYLVLAVVLLGGLFIVFKPQTNNQSITSQEKQDTKQATPSANVMESNKKEFTLVIKNKKLTSGNETLSVTEGDEVTIKITSDEAEELHMHGYDESVEFEKDEPAELTFTADKTGRFPFELEKSKIELGALEVQPK